VALFKATSPAMNIAVAVYVANMSGVPLTPAVLAAGIAVAMLSATGAPSLPGTISFIANIGPIAMAMGVPVAPLALLIAVEMLPDIVRTVGNATMDVAVAATVDRRTRE
jgi:Na+/H+-dicarboxylate symporter